MKNTYSTFLFISIISLQLSYSQVFKEISEFYDNGVSKKVVWKNEDLKILKSQVFDIKNKMISEYLYNPLTEKRNGNFFNTVNKGTYNEGVLNCMDCTINFDNDGEATQFRGEFINGKPVGKIKVYSVQEKYIEVYDPIMTYAMSLSLGQKINYSRYVGTGLYKTIFVLELNYNKNGGLEGETKIDSLTTVYFKDGNIDGLIRKSKENINVVQDSIFDKNKIWKINGEYHKNFGLPLYKYNEFRDPWNIKYSVLGSSESYSNGKVYEVYSYGSVVKTSNINDFPSSILIKNKKTLLNDNGVYYKIIEESNWDSTFLKISRQLFYLQNRLKQGLLFSYEDLKENNFKLDFNWNIKSGFDGKTYYTIEMTNDNKFNIYLTSIKSLLDFIHSGLKSNLTSTTQIYFWNEIKKDYELFDISLFEKELKRLNEF